MNADFMLVAAAIALFLIPMLLLVLAWRSAKGKQQMMELAIWRSHATSLALILASLAVLVSATLGTTMLASPYEAKPTLEKLSLSFLSAAFVTSFFARGKTRWFLLGVAPATVVALIVTFQPWMD